MKIPDHIKAEVAKTVGHSEAANKNSFMTGAQVAFGKSEDYFEEQLKTLTSQVDFYRAAFESAHNDMKTIVNIFNKYNDSE